MDSLRRSFKSQGSHKRSGTSSDFDHQEQQPILIDFGESSNDDGDHRREVVVNVDGNSRPLVATKDPGAWSGPGHQFWRLDVGAVRSGSGSSFDGGLGSPGFSFPSQQTAPLMSQRPPLTDIREDPPSPFIQKEKAIDSEVSLDVEMEELKKSTTQAPSPNAKELRVSFQEPSLGAFRQQHGGSFLTSFDSDDGGKQKDAMHPSVNYAKGDADAGEGEVLRCSSNSSFRRSPSMLRSRTRSRLMDPLPPRSSDAHWRDQPSDRFRSGPLKSGVPGQQHFDEDDDDPFLDEDVPDEYRHLRARFSVLVFLEWISLILIVGALVCSLSVPSLERKRLWRLHLWKWALMVLVLICGRLVSGWGIHILVFFFERNFLLRKRVLYFVYSLRRAFRNCCWLGLVLIAWYCIFDPKWEREGKKGPLSYITKILICLLLAAIARFVKTLLVKVLASSFHVGTYFDRIQESLFNQYVIETLSGPPLVEDEQLMAEVQKLRDAGASVPPEFRAAVLPSKSLRVSGVASRVTPSRMSTAGKSRRLAGGPSRRDVGWQDEGITVDHLHLLNSKNISAWNMKRLMKIVRIGTLSTLDEQITDTGGEDESWTQIHSEYEAKIAGKKIFTNVAKPGSKYIYLVDLMRFMREDEARKTMSLFDGAPDCKRVNRRSLKNWVVNVFRERRALALTLNDTKTAVNKLHQMVNIVAAIVVIIIWLLILRVATTDFLVFLSSQLLLVVFVFGNTCKMTFEAIIFLFVMHPFDVGDRCEVEGVQMVVEEMNILTTVFLRFDNQKVTFPNSELATKTIGNFYRSPDMGESVDFCIHVATPVEKVAIMKEKLKAFIESKKEHWYPNPMVVLRDVEDLNKLKVSIWFQHRMNHQDMGERHARRELVVQEMIRVFRELDIEYRMLPLDVNLRDAHLSSSRLPSTWVK